MLTDLFGRLKEAWGRFSPPQRMVTLLLVGAAVLAVGYGMYMNRDVYAVLYTGLDGKDAASIAAKLDEAKIPKKLSGDGGTISVPESQKLTAKLAMAQAGLPKGGTGPGLELFDTPQLTATDFDKRINLVRAKKGELEKALMMLDDVETAVVSLNPTESSAFVRDQRPPTASVIIKPKGGRKLPQKTANVIIAAAASTVEGLTFDNVRLADTAGTSYYYDGTGNQAGLDGDKLAVQRQQQADYEKSILRVLEPIFGPGHVVVAVTLDYNWETSKTERTDLGAPQPVSTSTSRESSTNTQTPKPVDPAAPPNYPTGTTGTGSSASDKYVSQTNYTSSSKTTTTTSLPAGTIKSRTASITIDAASLPDATATQIMKLAANALGATTNDIAVLPMPFIATTMPTLPTQKSNFQVAPLTLTIGLGGLALLILLYSIMALRRQPEPEPAMQPLLAGLPTMSPHMGTTLDVALGLERGADFGQPPRMGLPDMGTSGLPNFGEPEVPLPSAEQMEGKTARQQLEMVIQAKPKRQLVIGNQEIPPEFLTILEDLGTNASEACASVLSAWLKGTTNPNSKLSGPQKAAILSINVGSDLSARMIQHLADEEIEALTVQIARAEKVSATERDDLFQEFIEITTAERYIHSGGIDYARQLLGKAIGERRANDILQRLTTHLRKRPFDSVRRTDPSQLAGFLQNEHPQTVSVVLAHLPADQAALVIADLPPERQADIIKRIATLDPTSPEMLREAERVLERKLSALMAQESSAAGGVNWVVDVLNRVDRSTERGIMGTLSAEDPELANEIAQRMFLFEDIVRLDDITVQRVLRDVDMNKDLPLALKAAKEEVWRKITSNVSRRTSDALREAVDLLGPVRIRDVEEAQARIVGLIRKLDEMGEIQLTRGEQQDEFI
ncbi:MAG TPA: flagellar motor switch protein FliG [Symbiobacteriaceae bacterium]|jgi:flagellar motor switch protein FliG